MPTTNQPPRQSNPNDDREIIERQQEIISKLQTDLSVANSRASGFSFDVFTLGERISAMRFDQALIAWVAILGWIGFIASSIWIAIR